MNSVWSVQLISRSGVDNNKGKKQTLIIIKNYNAYNTIFASRAEHKSESYLILIKAINVLTQNSVIWTQLWWGKM